MKLTKIVCLGDSLTEGYNIKPKSSWPDLLNQDTDLEVINKGISGDTTSGMLSRFGTDVISNDPDIVFIMGGTNDLEFGLNESFVISQIKTMTRHARYHNIQSIIGIPPPIFIDNTEYEMHLKTFQNSLILFAKEVGWPIIDFTMLQRKFYLDDGVHQNEEGQIAMRDIAFHAFERILI